MLKRAHIWIKLIKNTTKNNIVRGKMHLLLQIPPHYFPLLENIKMKNAPLHVSLNYVKNNN